MEVATADDLFHSIGRDSGVLEHVGKLLVHLAVVTKSTVDIGDGKCRDMGTSIQAFCLLNVEVQIIHVTTLGHVTALKNITPGDAVRFQIVSWIVTSSIGPSDVRERMVAASQFEVCGQLVVSLVSTAVRDVKREAATSVATTSKVNMLAALHRGWHGWSTRAVSSQSTNLRECSNHNKKLRKRHSSVNVSW